MELSVYSDTGDFNEEASEPKTTQQYSALTTLDFLAESLILETVGLYV
jgi:hypothetical protein